MRAQLGEKLSPGTLTVPAAVPVSDQPLKNDTSTADRDSAVQSTSNGPTDTRQPHTPPGEDHGDKREGQGPRIGLRNAEDHKPSTLWLRRSNLAGSAATLDHGQQTRTHAAAHGGGCAAAHGAAVPAAHGRRGPRAQALIRHLLSVARFDNHRDDPRGRPVVRKGRAIGRAAPQRHPLQAKQLQQRAAAAMDASQASGRRQIAKLSKVKGACGRP